eukprot:PLAT3500.3.p1 GENE.PLAT3500.3~~PLAT3500.3.p1  ORF type:complete len:1555 (+),score=822.25 PLAT3500.3:520-4665(+)
MEGKEEVEGRTAAAVVERDVPLHGAAAVEDGMWLHPFGLPCAVKMLSFLSSLLSESDPATCCLALRWLATALRAGGSALQSCPSLLSLLRDDLTAAVICAAQAGDLDVLGAALRVVHAMYIAAKPVLKLQLQALIDALYLPVLDGTETSYARQEMVMESLLSLISEAGFLTELFVNFDCDPEASNMFALLMDGLRRTLHEAGDELTGVQMMALEALMVWMNELDRRAAGVESDHDDDDDVDHADDADEEAAAADAAAAGADDGVLPSHDSAKAGAISVDERSAAAEGDAVQAVALEQRERALSGSMSAALSPTMPPAVLQQHVLRAQKRKRLLEHAAQQFNESSKLGIAFLQQHCLVSREAQPREIARFLRDAPGLNHDAIGEYLGKIKDFNQECLKEFVATFDFEGESLLDSLRSYLTSFRLPGEAQVIDRMVQTFADRAYLQSTDASHFAGADTTFLLAFAIIMLNTDLHNPNIAEDRKMTMEQFIKYNTNYGPEVSKGVDLPRSLLTSVYTSIRDHEIRVLAPHEFSPDAWRDELRRVRRHPHRTRLLCWSHDAPQLAIFDRHLLDCSWRAVLQSLSAAFHRADAEADVRAPRAAAAASDSEDGSGSEAGGAPAAAAAGASAALAGDSVDEGHEGEPAGWKAAAAASSAAVAMSDSADGGTMLLPAARCGVQPALDGFHLAARLSAQHGLSAALDSLIIELSRFSRLSQSVAQLLQNHKSRQALLAMIQLAAMHGDIVRDAWQNIISNLLRLVEMGLLSFRLLPEAQLVGSDELERAAAAERARKEEEDAAAAAAASRGFFSMFWGSSPRTRAAAEEFIDDAERSLLCRQLLDCDAQHILPDSKFLQLDALLHVIHAVMLAARGSSGLDGLPPASSDATTSSSSPAASSSAPPPPPAAEAGSEDGSVTAEDGKEDGGDDPPPPIPPVSIPMAAAAAAAGSSKSTARAMLCLQLLTDVALRNRDRIAIVWPRIHDYFAAILAGDRLTPLQQRACIALLRLCTRLLHKEAIAPMLLRSLELLRGTPSAQVPSLARDIANGLFELVKANAGHITDMAGWRTIFGIIQSYAHLTAEDCAAAFKALSFLLLDPHLRAHVPMTCIATVEAYVDSTAAGDGRCRAALDLLLSLHLRLRPLVDGDSDTRSRLFGWWMPLLVSLARSGRDARPAVRLHALATLQRAVLDMHGSVLTGEQWSDLFQTVLLPLGSDIARLPAASASESMLGRLRMAAITLLCKTFLLHLSTLKGSEQFKVLWLKLLRLLETFKAIGGHVAEAVVEMLKNALLVMASVGVFDCTDDGFNGRELWDWTWAAVDPFCPGLRAEVFPDGLPTLPQLPEAAATAEAAEAEAEAEADPEAEEEKAEEHGGGEGSAGGGDKDVPAS